MELIYRDEIIIPRGSTWGLMASCMPELIYRDETSSIYQVYRSSERRLQMFKPSSRELWLTKREIERLVPLSIK